MTNTTIDPRLSHLTPLELETPIARYYKTKDRVDDLIREYSIDCAPAKLSSLFPEVVLDDHRCRYCNVPMIQLRRSRTHGSTRLAYCPECGHQTGASRCSCWKCVVAVDRHHRYQRYEPQIDLIGAYARTSWPETFFDGSASDIDLFTAVGLLALVRACLFLELRGKRIPNDYPLTLDALSTATVPFAPTHKLSSKLIDSMMASKLVGISELSDNSAFVFQQGSIAGYYLSSIRWTLTIQDAMELIHNVEELARSPQDWPRSWHAQSVDFWKAIAFAECEQFYGYCSEQRGLPVAEEQSVAAMLENLLQDYSVAQCYRIIYAGAQKAADFLVRKQSHPKHAANYMVGECQRWADRARAEQWEVKGFRRNYDLPRSSLSYVLLDAFLGIGEEGFTSTPRAFVAK